MSPRQDCVSMAKGIGHFRSVLSEIVAIDQSKGANNQADALSVF